MKFHFCISPAVNSKRQFAGILSDKGGRQSYDHKWL